MSKKQKIHLVVGIVEVLAGIFFLVNTVSDIQFGFGAVLLFMGLSDLTK